MFTCFYPLRLAEPSTSLPPCGRMSNQTTSFLPRPAVSSQYGLQVRCLLPAMAGYRLPQDLRDLKKPDLLVEESLDRHFVGCIENGGNRASGLRGLISKLQTRETFYVGRMKVQCQRLLEVERAE